MEVEEIAAATICLARVYEYYIAVLNNKVAKNKWRKRRWWMVSIHRNRTRESMESQISELLIEPSGQFDNFVRMSFTDFEYLLQKIAPTVAKQDTKWRDAIPVKIRLAITLRFLATGDSYKSLHYLFKTSSQIISKIIPEVCLALIEVLKECIKMPTTTDEWMSKADRFRYPHCLGAIDGKHVVIRAPQYSGSEYFNYKGDFSIVLLAVVDHDYCFMFADIGSQGRISDGGVFNQSVFKKKIEAVNMNVPHPSPLPDSDIVVPYVFLGDGAFALSSYLMKPFSGYHALGSPERVFNQELSSSRVVVENTFGILSSVFRIFQRSMHLDEMKASIVTKTCVLLHNFLRKSKNSRNIYTPLGSCDIYENGQLIRPGSWRNNNQGSGMLPLQPVGRRSTRDAIEIRLNFMKYFYNKRNNLHHE